MQERNERRKLKIRKKNYIQVHTSTLQTRKIFGSKSPLTFTLITCQLEIATIMKSRAFPSIFRSLHPLWSSLCYKNENWEEATCDLCDMLKTQNVRLDYFRYGVTHKAHLSERPRKFKFWKLTRGVSRGVRDQSPLFFENLNKKSWVVPKTL